MAIVMYALHENIYINNSNGIIFQEFIKMLYSNFFILQMACIHV
jgi:hypothetical protein